MKWIPRAVGSNRGALIVCLTAGLLSAALIACTIYGRPTKGKHGEPYSIARALSQGQGFANPFGDRVGPTAWVAPAYPTIMAGLLWLGGGNHDVLTAGLLCFHVPVLIGTGILVLALVRQTTQLWWTVVAAMLFFLATLYHFRYWFQSTDDPWLIMLTLDLLLAGFCWLRPLDGWPRAAAWGLVGGLCALASPIVGFVWGIGSLVLAVRQRRWRPFAVAILSAGLTLAPWAIRNYLVFGRLIPVKSNLAFELYQSQCLQRDGLLRNFHSHPYGRFGPEGRAYRQLGETAFLDRKWEQFQEAVRAHPIGFLNRLSSRVLGATLWYVPFSRADEAAQPWLLWTKRLTHPLPFLAMLLLVATSMHKPLSRPQWAVIGVYVLYLLPYVASSYYERYAVPLLAVKVLLVIWAMDRLVGRVIYFNRGTATCAGVNSNEGNRSGVRAASPSLKVRPVRNLSP
jgi:hypothetical protein